MGVSFHAVVAFGLGKNLLFKSVLEHCAIVDPPDCLLTENNSVSTKGLKRGGANINRRVESASLPDWNKVNV